MIAPLLAALAAQSAPAVVTADLGCGKRAIAGDVAIVSRGRSATVTTRCVPAVGPTRRSTVTIRFAPTDGAWLAALDPLSPIQAVARREALAQSFTVSRDGTPPCATVRIVPLTAAPLPRRFLGDDGDWQATTDILATADCGAVAVRAGNRIALFAVGASTMVRLGDFRVEVRQGAADGDDRGNAHHHGRGRR